MTTPTYNLRPYVDDMIGLQRSIGGNMILQNFISNAKMSITWHNIQGETKTMSLNDFLVLFINSLNKGDLHYADTDRIVLLQNVRVAISFLSNVMTEASSTLDYERVNVIRDSLDSLSEAFTRIEEVLANEPVVITKPSVNVSSNNRSSGMSFIFKFIILLISIIVLVVLYYYFFGRSESFSNKYTVVLRS